MVPRCIPAILLLPLVASCAKGDKVPSYVEIPAVTLTTTTAQGMATSKVTDVWVSVDESFLGVWELPARVPILAEGPHRIDVVPGVKRNGLFDARVRYPLYTTWTGQVNLTREGTATINAAVQYQPTAEFWIEGFEDTFIRLNTTEASDTTLIRFTPAEHPDLLYLENTPCGGFRLDAANPYIRIYTDEDFEASSGPVFLELDYRNDLAFTVGVLFSADNTPTSVPLVILVPTRRSDGTMPWNKVYIDLSGLFNSGVADRDIYIEASLPSSVPSASVYLDNLKLVRFP